MAPPEPTPPDATAVVRDAFGGPRGMVHTALPVVAFVVSNALWSLWPAIAVAVGVAALLTGWRALRGQRVGPALSGLLGVAVAGGVAAWTGDAGGFFLLGIWTNLVGAVLVAVSLLARRPVTGLLWNLVHGNRYAWRADRGARTAHDVATLALGVVCAARFCVQWFLYDTDATGWLAAARIGMGYPLLAVVLLVVVWAFRRSTERLVRA